MKSIILSEFYETWGYRKPNQLPKRRKPKPRHGRPRYEKAKLLDILKTIWLATNQMGSKKLKAALPDWLPFYEQENRPLSDSVRGQLYSLSPATFDRWLAPYRKEKPPRRGLSGTKPGTLLKKSNTHQNGPLGREAPRLFRSGYGCALR